MCPECEMPDVLCDCSVRPVRRAPAEIRYARVCLVCEGKGIVWISKPMPGGWKDRKEHCDACGGTGREGGAGGKNI